jgi:hypothetical protein
MSDVVRESSVSNWRLFAWQGVRCETPPNWELAGESGDERRGYCRLDDGNMTRLEIRWQCGGTGAISEVADRFLAALSKKGRRPLPRVQRNTRLVEIPDSETETFSWRDETSVTGLAVRCGKCGRTCLLRAHDPPSEPFGTTAARVLSSFRDHGSEGRVPWSVLGFRFDVPEGYALSDHALRAGRLELGFRAGRVSARAVRVSLASMVLQQGQADWLKKDPSGSFPRGEVAFAETAVQGHPAVEVRGRQRSRLRDLFRRSLSIHCRAWCCPESNSIRVARWIGPEKSEAEFELFAGSFVCHD